MTSIFPPPQIQIPPAFWHQAHWRNLPPLPRPDVRPLNWETILKRLHYARDKTRHSWAWHWSRIEPQCELMDYTEAQFWVTMITQYYTTSTALPAAKLAPELYQERLTFTELKSLMASRQRGYGLWPDQIIMPLLSLVSPAELLSLLIDLPHSLSLARYVQKNVYPWLTAAERQEAQQFLRLHLSQLPPWPTATNRIMPMAYSYAAIFGLSHELETIVFNWTDLQFGKNPNQTELYIMRPQEMVLGLSTPQNVVEQMKRLRLSLKTEEYIYWWLAHTEDTQLAYVQNAIVGQKKISVAHTLTLALGQVHTPAVVEPLLHLLEDSCKPQTAREWLYQHPDITIPGLIHLASGRGRLAELAQTLLKGLSREGHQTIIETLADDKVASKLWQKTAGQPLLTEADTPEWLLKASKALKVNNSKFPAGLTAAQLPPLIISTPAGEKLLSTAHMELILYTFFSDSQTATHLLDELPQHATAASLSEFGWQLLEIGAQLGRDKRKSWAFEGVARWATPEQIIALARLVGEWGQERKRYWVEDGLKTIRLNGSDTAVLQLYQLRQTLPVKYQPLAVQHLHTLAQTKNLSEEELGDQAVPTCGLDETGRGHITFGQQTLTFVLGADLTPLVQDAKGKLRSSLPQPKAKDDPQQVQEARLAWKLLKKQVKDVLAVQSGRFEQAMVLERRWSWEKMNQFIVRHPLLQYMARTLVWGSFNPAGQLTHTFRLTSDGEWVNEFDEPLTPDPLVPVGVVHPLHLKPAGRQNWAKLLADYEILQPFPQLGREIYEPNEQEVSQQKILTLPPPLHVRVLISKLKAYGWRKAERELYVREFAPHKLEAVVDFETVRQGQKYHLRQITNCYFRSKASHNLDQQVTFAQMSRLILSEVLRDLRRL